MRQPKGEWKDLFGGFMLALDMRKLFFAFMGLLFSLLLVGLFTFGWTALFVDGEGPSNVFVKTVEGTLHPAIPDSFTPHAILGWFKDRWVGFEAGGRHVDGIFDKHPVNGLLYVVFASALFLLIWSYFGGAITRIAACEIAREGERIEASKALRYARKKFWSFFGAPLICVLGFLFFYLVVFVVAFVFRLLDYAYIGAPLGALLLPLVILAGFIMTLILLGAATGFPLFHPAVAAEGTDAFDAFSRGFSYVFSRPWHYLWYQIVTAAYGYVCVAFVILFAVLMTHVGFSAAAHGFEIWGAWESSESEGGRTDFDRISNWAWTRVLSGVHAKTEYQWTPRQIAYHPHPYGRVMHLASLAAGRSPDDFDRANFPARPRWHGAAAFITLAWLIVVMGLAYSFAVSYFFSQQTMIYFILRKKVDEIEIKEVYDEEEETDRLTGEPPPSPPAPKPEEPASAAQAEAPKVGAGRGKGRRAGGGKRGTSPRRKKK